MTRGATLVELLVVLTVIAIASAVSLAAWPARGHDGAESPDAAVRRARLQALRTARPVRVTILRPGGDDIVRVVLLPDGSARGPGLEPFTATLRDGR